MSNFLHVLHIFAEVQKLDTSKAIDEVRLECGLCPSIHTVSSDRTIQGKINYFQKIEYKHLSFNS